MTTLVGALGPQIADLLRREIVSGKVAPGERLVETELAERFDVSRGPIRDALRELTAERLVEVRRRSTFAVGVTADDIDEIFSLRLAIETLATQRLILRRGDVRWADFDRPLERMRDAADMGDAAAFGRADLAFHEEVYRQSGHRRLLASWSQIVPTLDALLRGNAWDRDLHPSVTVHETYLALMRDGSTEEVLDGLGAHLKQAHDRLLVVIEQSPTA